MSTDPTRRFSSRVENYVKYRPGYPPSVVELLADECGLTPASVVADVGSGAGILSGLLLRNGNRVYGVEPNREMRESGARLLSAYEKFVSVEGRAEATTLPGASVDFVTAGQSLHWFDPEGARREFLRILRPGGWAVAVWNDRRTEGTPFLENYEHLLLEYGTDYREVSVRYAEEKLLRAFYGPAGFREKTFANRQVLDFEGLRGRLVSSSYSPEPGDPHFEPMIRELRAVFERHQQGGLISFDYDTRVFYGQLK